MAKQTSRPTETIQASAVVQQSLYDEFKAVADRHERSVAGELRVAIRHWVEQHLEKDAA